MPYKVIRGENKRNSCRTRCTYTDISSKLIPIPNSRRKPKTYTKLELSGAASSIIGGGGGGGRIFISSCSALLTSFEIDCFYGLWTQIYEYSTPPPIIELAAPLLELELQNRRLLPPVDPCSMMWCHSRWACVRSSCQSVGSDLWGRIRGT
jgi:hypothetical protein